jgi:hypothetical protein
MRLELQYMFPLMRLEYFFSGASSQSEPCWRQHVWSVGSAFVTAMLRSDGGPNVFARLHSIRLYDVHGPFVNEC